MDYTWILKYLELSSQKIIFFFFTFLNEDQQYKNFENIFYSFNYY